MWAYVSDAAVQLCRENLLLMHNCAVVFIWLVKLNPVNLSGTEGHIRVCAIGVWTSYSGLHDWLNMVMLKGHWDDMVSIMELHGSLWPISIFIPISFSYTHSASARVTCWAEFACIVNPFPWLHQNLRNSIRSAHNGLCCSTIRRMTTHYQQQH